MVGEVLEGAGSDSGGQLFSPGLYDKINTLDNVLVAS
jgi:hypothetical protein